MMIKADTGDRARLDAAYIEGRREAAAGLTRDPYKFRDDPEAQDAYYKGYDWEVKRGRI